MKFKEVYEIEIQWVYCPICKNKTRIKIRFDTEMKKFPLFCPKCKQETLINVENLHMDSRDRAVILLAGLPSLNNSLRLGIHEPLRQRIVMNYNLDGIISSSWSCSFMTVSFICTKTFPRFNLL